MAKRYFITQVSGKTWAAADRISMKLEPVYINIILKENWFGSLAKHRSAIIQANSMEKNNSFLFKNRRELKEPL